MHRRGRALYVPGRQPARQDDRAELGGRGRDRPLDDPSGSAAAGGIVRVEQWRHPRRQILNCRQAEPFADRQRLDDRQRQLRIRRGILVAVQLDAGQSGFRRGAQDTCQRLVDEHAQPAHERRQAVGDLPDRARR
jgi:hypothetical protein